MKLKVFIIIPIILVALAIIQSVAIQIKDAQLAQNKTVNTTPHTVKNFKHKTA